MNTLKNLKNGNFVRVSDVEAESRIKSKTEWAYAPKSDWKKRNNSAEDASDVSSETIEKPKKKGK